MEWLKKTVASIAAFYRKYKEIINGAGAYRIASWIYDKPLWQLVELRWEESGVLVMVIGAILLNTIFLIIFKNKKADFILWSLLDSLSEKESIFGSAYGEWTRRKTPWKFYLVIASYIPVKISMFILCCMKKSPLLGDIAAFVLLPLIEDPFVTTMYLRHGYKNGLRLRDWLIYLATTVISISYWTTRNAIIVETVFRPVLKLF